MSHYGIGSPSHGVGRELTAHQVTSAWVDEGVVDFFPLLVGWRVLGQKCEIDFSEFDGAPPRRQWGKNWPHLQRRLSALSSAPKSVALFLEYMPQTLGDWLHRSFTIGNGASAFTEAVTQIIEATTWMNAQGFQHFDVHPGNILIQDGKLLFTDFGLSLYRGFDLTLEEKSAMASHGNFDHDTGLTHLFHWVLYELGYTVASDRLTLLRSAAADPKTSLLDPVRVALGSGADLIAQHANIAVYITEMFNSLMQDAAATRYNSALARNKQ